LWGGARARRIDVLMEMLCSEGRGHFWGQID
jgi:hypothetical protein